MALARAIPLKDATASAVSSGANGTAYDLRTIIAAGLKMYAGLHMTTQSTDSFVGLFQSASSSGFAVATTEFILTAMTSRAGQWGTSGGVAIGSTDRIFWRMRWTLSTGSLAPSAKFLGWVSIQ